MSEIIVNLMVLVVIIGILLYTFLVGILCFKWGRYTKERKIEMNGASSQELEELEKVRMSIKYGYNVYCPCCQSTDLLITAKKVICKSCNNWSWLEDAVYSGWFKEIDSEEENADGITN